MNYELIKNVINVDNLDISYITNNKNDSKTLLFVHGWKADKYNLSSIYSHLLKEFNIISIDLPGFGESSMPTNDFGSPEYANIVAFFLKKLNFEKVVCIGHSFGGKIGILLSIFYPDLIEKLVLINSAGIKQKRGLNWYLKVWSFKFMKFIHKKLTKDEELLIKLKNNFGSDDYRNAGALRSIFLKVVNEDYTNILGNVKCPTFIYWGEKDNATPLWMAKKLNNLIKDSGLYIVAGGGHFSFLDDDRIIDIIRVFCNSL